MNDVKQFVERWTGRGDEKGETQKFWNELLQCLFDIDTTGDFIKYETRVALEHKGFIDGYIPLTRTLIEQKSRSVNLDNPQEGHDGMTPYEQAKKYYDGLPLSMKGRWIVVCNFDEFRIYDMEGPNLVKPTPEIIKLADLPREWRKLQFMTDTNAKAPKEIHEEQLSISAGELVKKLQKTLESRYVNPDSERAKHSLVILCVRIVFLLYAEDAELGRKDGEHFIKSEFHDYLKVHEDSPRRALMDLFSVLNQKPEERDPYIDGDLKTFPYVNGGLFEERDIEIPNLDGEPLNIILNDMSEGFDWSGISPTIFGAIFESVLNPDTRRAGGMHYTSIENIHRVIDPLFLDGLRAELHEAISAKTGAKKKLIDFQKKLASFKFLDPACGSGNFLTETYLCLRRMENRILSELTHGQINFAEGEFTPIQVSIGQFYGIEINDFAVSVARTALWIAEDQMMKETRGIVDIRDDVLPLKSYNHIVEGNALKIDWRSVVEKPDYIMGNPPFLGYTYQSPEQKQDMEKLCGTKKIDYVACWYFKAAEMIRDSAIRAAFVSTNSITQGEQAAAVWKPLFERSGVHIDFAWRTFVWDSEANDKAHVHVVIIGFSHGNMPSCGVLYNAAEDGTTEITNAKHINPYLVDAPDVFVASRQKPLCDVPEMTTGNRPADGGNLLLTREERDELLKAEPQAREYIKRFMGAQEFLNGDERYCLWLVGISPAELKKMPAVLKCVEACRQDRLNAPDAGRRKLADTPWLFRETQNPEHYLVIPKVSSERREYIPIGFMTSETISSDLVFILPNAMLYHFGVLESSVHMAWMRVVAGRLEMRYRYSKDIVYNNFPWPTPTPEQRAKIEQTAQGILDARAFYPDSSLADLYDELTMPPELRKAHRANDAAVCAAYGFDKDITEPEVVARLMGMYEKLVKVNQN